MIAQGDFLKILNASSNDRRELFQKLFNTSIFQNLQFRLQDMNRSCTREQEDLNRRITIAAGKITPEDDFPERENIALYKTEARYADLLMECLGRLIEREKDSRSQSAEDKAAAGKKAEALIAAIEQGKAVNADFDALKKARSDLETLLDQQSAMDDRAAALSEARKALGLAADEALVRSNAAEIQRQQKELAEASEALAFEEKTLPEAKAALEGAEARAPEADALRASADQMKACLPVLKDLEKQKKELANQKQQMAVLLEESNQADQAYTAAKEGYYRSQAGLLAAELKDGAPCPACGSLSHPQPAQLTDEAVTREAMERADQRHRQAADALHKADKALESLSTAVEAGMDRLRGMSIAEDETERHVKQRIRDVESQAKQIRDAIDERREAYTTLTIQIAKNRTSVEDGQKRLSSLHEKGAQLAEAFRERMTAAGFEDEPAYQRAKLSERDIADMEDRLRAYGEQKRHGCIHF